jgi:hypothetical protein
MSNPLEKKLALAVLVEASVRMSLGKHVGCSPPVCLPLEDLRLSALAYALATLKAIESKRVDADRKPGQACREALAAVVEELRVAVAAMSLEQIARVEKAKGVAEHGATQAPGEA